MSIFKKKVPLTKNDSIQGISFKYEYEAEGSYGFISLILKKNGTYLYRQSSIVEGISDGKWEFSNNYLILQSSLQKSNIPVKISYGLDGDFTDSFSIAVVKNINNKPLTEATILVNTDTIECLPLTGQCTGSFQNIKRIKVVFENGLSSQWIPVEGDNKKIVVTVLSEMSIGNYIVMDKEKFKIKNDYLKSE